MFGLDAEHIIPVIVLTLLAVSLLGSALRHNALRNGFIWVLIFAGAIAGAGMWQDISRDLTSPPQTFSGGRIEVYKQPDNHFHLTLQINGVDIEFLVDTGASQVVLTLQDAARVGLNPDTLNFIGTAMTANGEVATAPVRLDRVDLGEMTDTRVRASVNSGEMDRSLLGMSYLSRFESIEIRQDVLILNR